MITDSDSSTVRRALLQRAGQGDTAAFAELYDRTAPAVFGLIHSILAEAGQAEDVALAVYLHAWRTASRYDPGREDASTLLMTTARRHALDRLRATPPRDGASEQPRRAAYAADPARRQSLARMLAAVPVASREVLTLIYFRGQTLAAVAELLGIPRATVLSRLNDALSSLRQRRDGRSVRRRTRALAAIRPRRREDSP